MFFINQAPSRQGITLNMQEQLPVKWAPTEAAAVAAAAILQRSVLSVSIQSSQALHQQAAARNAVEEVRSHSGLLTPLLIVERFKVI